MIQPLIIRKKLRDRELNPGLPRDRRGYYPLYYRGFAYTPTLIAELEDHHCDIEESFYDNDSL